MAGIFTTITTTTPAVPGVTPMPVHIRIDGTVERSDILRVKRDSAVMARVREIYAQAYEDNEAMRLRIEQGRTSWEDSPAIQPGYRPSYAR